MKRLLLYLIFTVLSFFSFSVMSCSKDEPAKQNDLTVTSKTKADTLRLISYNILEGMKLDKDNNFDKFVNWMKSYSPDIVALEEAYTIAQKKSNVADWAKRWGHEYSVTYKKSDDNYPVSITSKYPITVKSEIVDGVSHGALYVQIEGVNIVVLHLWPMSYARTAGGWDKDTSHDYDKDGDVDGDDYRISEINIFLDETIRTNPKEKNWLMMGDFNSSSPKDKDILVNAIRSYQVHQDILNASYGDLVRQMHNEFLRSCPTVYGGWKGYSGPGSRIDFIYGSRSIANDVVDAGIIYDEFTDNYSDHYPVFTDFRVYR